MSSRVFLSAGAIEALRHMKETREINTVVLRRADVAGALVVEVEANLTHEELLQALPIGEPRLVVHELSFASREGARRHEQLLILWLPTAAGGGGQMESYAAAYASLKNCLGDARVHLTAEHTDQLEYRKLVALVG
ncbi:cofilin family protein [Streptomyces sp. NPDC054838]